MSEYQEPYAKHLVLDMTGCDTTMFTRRDIALFMEQMCQQLDVRPAILHFWDGDEIIPGATQLEGKVGGISAVQFLLQSTIVVHTLELLGKAYIDIFVGKQFNDGEIAAFCERFFKAQHCEQRVLQRW